MAEEEEQEREGDPEDTNTIAYIKERRDTPLLERKDITAISKLGSNKDDKGIEWLDVEEPLDLVDTSEESVYESLIKKMPKCSLNYDFRIKKGDPRNLKISWMIGYKFTANTYIDVDLPINIMSLAYYNSIRKNGYEYMGRNFIGLGRAMHVFVGNMSYIIDFTILDNIETNNNPSLSHVIFGRPFIEITCLAINRKHGSMTFMDGTREITFKTPYKDPERSELSSEGHDLLSSRVILSENNYDRGCRKPFELEDGFYRDTIKIGPEYATKMDDEGEATKAHLLEDKQIPSVGIFDEFLALEGNTCNLGSFGDETDKITDLHQIHEEVLFTERRDGVAGIKRRRRDLSSDGVRDLATASGRGRLKEDLESSK
ncbi:hypothetical protein Tco_0564957 [Tanacetum coccineum]